MNVYEIEDSYDDTTELGGGAPPPYVEISQHFASLRERDGGVRQRQCLLVFHAGQGGTAPALRRIIIAALDLVKFHLVEVSAVQRFCHLVYHRAATR